MRVFKASKTRLGRKHGIEIVCVSDASYVYIQLASETTSALPTSEA